MNYKTIYYEATFNFIILMTDGPLPHSVHAYHTLADRALLYRTFLSSWCGEEYLTLVFKNSLSKFYSDLMSKPNNRLEKNNPQTGSTGIFFVLSFILFNSHLKMCRNYVTIPTRIKFRINALVFYWSFV